jgi:MFS family permease
MMILMTYFSGILVLAMWLPSKSNAPIIVFAALYGFGSGAFVSLGPAVMAQISQVREIGIRQGTYFAIISIAALIGSPIGGVLVPEVLTGDYWKLQVFCGVVMMAGSTLILFARIAAGGLNPLTKV